MTEQGQGKLAGADTIQQQDLLVLRLRKEDV
jgi:hypothetical protein